MKSYSIYQVSDNAENAHYIKFSGLDLIEKMGLKVTRDLYEKVYEGDIEDFTDADEVLENLYIKFQGTKPAGYTGHSLSVSDVVELDGKAYYCDSYGFTEIQF